MAINCTRCQGSGFLNLEQCPLPDGTDCGEVLAWIVANTDHDVRVCDCCGDGEGWYGEPGSHYTSQDPIGRNGPYAYNGGLCECH